MSKVPCPAIDSLANLQCKHLHGVGDVGAVADVHNGRRDTAPNVSNSRHIGLISLSQVSYRTCISTGLVSSPLPCSDGQGMKDLWSDASEGPCESHVVVVAVNDKNLFDGDARQDAPVPAVSSIDGAVKE